MKKGYICIHGHFYQPPRENPYIEWIQRQESAYPYHDWNERVNAECYAPNARSRILDEGGRIIRIVNNYLKMSFNFGPTLIDWLVRGSPEVYRLIIEADRLSDRHYNGHGNAISQAYNHIIMPLARSFDKKTQIIWGIKNFIHHFGRRPEGMWLPEAAVDLETLDLMAEEGIGFTVLSPSQALRVRRMDNNEWTEVSAGEIDTTVPYIQRLPSGRTITIFFYNHEIASEVAFGGLLKDGKALAERLLKQLENSKSSVPPIVSIATDGETYGHHHKFTEMALSYAMDYIQHSRKAEIINYAAYLAMTEPQYEVEIKENTSWSCSHGVERWRADCGCTTGGHPQWHQKWRAPLRKALDLLRERTWEIYKEYAEEIFHNPEAARNDYIDVILDRSERTKKAFFKKHCRKSPDRTERITALRLLEMERNSMLMFTSCGWFFDDISRIETVQILRYAARAMDLAKAITGKSLEEEFLDILSEAESNIHEKGTGADIYRAEVSSDRIDHKRIVVHFALSSTLEETAQLKHLYCYEIQPESTDRQSREEGLLITGLLKIRSVLTEEEERFIFAAICENGADCSAYLKEASLPQRYGEIRDRLVSQFARGMSSLYEEVDAVFGPDSFGLKDLFSDEQERLLDGLVRDPKHEAQRQLEEIYRANSYLIFLLNDLGLKVPGVFRMAAETALKGQLLRELKNKDVRLEEVSFVLEQMKRLNIELKPAPIEITLRRRIEEEMKNFQKKPDLLHLQRIHNLLSVVFVLPFRTNLWMVQNIYYEMHRELWKDVKKRADTGDRDAMRWCEEFWQLGERLFFNMEAIEHA